MFVIVQTKMAESKGQAVKAQTEPRDFEWESKTLNDLFDLYVRDPEVGAFDSVLLNHWPRVAGAAEVL